MLFDDLRRLTPLAQRLSMAEERDPVFSNSFATSPAAVDRGSHALWDRLI